MQRSKFLLAAVLAATALLFAPATSRADFFLNISIDGVSQTPINITTADVDPTFTASNHDVITVIGSYLTNSPGAGTGVVLTADTAVYENGADGTSTALSSHYVTITVVSTGFTSPGLSGSALNINTTLTLQHGLTSSQLGTGATQDQFTSTGTGNGGSGTSATTDAASFTSDPDTGAFNSAATSFIDGNQNGNNYSITTSANVLVSTSNSGLGTQIQFEEDSTVFAPAPAGLVMLAGALPFAGLLRIRGRSNPIAAAI